MLNEFGWARGFDKPEDLLLNENRRDEGRAKNRRVELVKKSAQ